MEIKIKAIIPNSGMSNDVCHSRGHMLSAALSSEASIVVENIPVGPLSIESNTDEVLMGPPLVTACKKAEREGFDAVVVYCFSDVGVEAIRENVTIPVIGPGALTFAIADTLSDKFTVITTTDANISRTYRRIVKNPVVKMKLASVRALNIPVVDLRASEALTRERLLEICREEVESNGIDTVVLACLGMAQYGAFLEEVLGVTVLDPAFIAVAMAETFVRLKIGHSPIAYPALNKRQSL